MLENNDEPITSDAFIQTQVKYLNFDWFSLQTRIRQMVQNLMNPFLRRAEEDRATVVSVKVINDTLKKKVDELLFISAKQAQRGGEIEEMNSRISQIEADKKLFEARVTQEVKIM